MEFDWQPVILIGVYTLAVGLCLAGVVLSGLSLSGTWLVLAATGLLAWVRGPTFPGTGTFTIFLLLCLGVEGAEALASAWGVQKRGGSKTTGWAALAGGMIGMFLGGFTGIPVLGNLLGMLAGSFGLAFLVEHAQIKKTHHAARVATGAVLARLAVILLKVGVTLAMVATLIIGGILSP